MKESKVRNRRKDARETKKRKEMERGTETEKREEGKLKSLMTVDKKRKEELRETHE